MLISSILNLKIKYDILILKVHGKRIIENLTVNYVNKLNTQLNNQI